MFKELLKNNNVYGIYTVKDRLAKTFSPLFIQKNDATAQRMFKATKTPENFAYQDQELIFLGTFNMKDGTIQIEVDGQMKPSECFPVSVMNGKDEVA